MVRGVEHLFDLRDFFLDQALDARLERHVRRAAALAAAAHLQVDLVVLHLDQLNEAAVTRHRGIDGRVDQLLHLGRKLFTHVVPPSWGGLVYTQFPARVYSRTMPSSMRDFI